MKLEAKIDYIKAQTVMVNALVLKCHAEIVSGAYKLRKFEKPDPSAKLGYHPCTDEGKLETVMATMKAQCDRLGDLSEALAQAYAEAGSEGTPRVLTSFEQHMKNKGYSVR